MIVNKRYPAKSLNKYINCMIYYILYFLFSIFFNYAEHPKAKNKFNKDSFKMRCCLQDVSTFFMSKNNCFIVKKQLSFEDHCSLISDDLYSSTTTCVECLKMAEKLKHSKILLGVFFTSTVTLLGVIIFYKINKFKKGMNSLIEDEVSLATVCSDKNENLRTPIKLTDSINDNTELTILAELKKFEDNLMFTRKGITLGNLATEFQTNVKYFKEHRADNFKSYINNLRINYIVNKVKNDPSFKRYKLSYLAELSGFPTASSFTKTFKDIIGTTPSLYFSQIKDDEN